MRRRYGITLTQYYALLHMQGGVCAICGVKARGGRNGFSVDHDHANGRVRGLLCHACNLGIGKFNDNLALVKAAAVYLQRGGFVYGHQEPRSSNARR